MNEQRTDAPPQAPKPKKSVALSGVAAGNTALCTVGRTGNDLHYRGYDILDIAETVRIRGDRVPAGARQAAQRAPSSRPTRPSSRSLRGLPATVKACLEHAAGVAHPMDVMRTGVSALGCVLPEKDDHNVAGRARHRRPADGVARLDAALLVPLQPQRPAHRGRDRRRFDRRALPAPAARQAGRASSGCGRCTPRSILYAEHEFNASTFAARVIAGTGADMYSAITGAHRRAARPEARRRQRGRVRDPEALRHARRGRGRHPPPRRGQGSGHRLRPPGLHDRRPAQPGHQGSRAPAVEGRRQRSRCSTSPSGSRR